MKPRRWSNQNGDLDRHKYCLTLSPWEGPVMRARLSLTALALGLAAVLFSQGLLGRAAEPAKPAKDPWVGEYRQFGGFQPDKRGRVALTKEDGYYRLSTEDGAHKGYRFVEEKPGVLRDEKHIYGQIYL